MDRVTEITCTEETHGMTGGYFVNVGHDNENGGVGRIFFDVSPQKPRHGYARALFYVPSCLILLKLMTCQAAKILG